MDGFEDGFRRLGERFHHFVGVERDGARKPGHEAAALDLFIADLRALLDAADALFQLLRRAHSDEQVVLAADVFDDCLVKRFARRFDGFGLHNAVERYDRGFRRAAADVDDHMTVRTVHVQTRADRRSDRRGDEIDLASARLDDGVDDGVRPSIFRASSPTLRTRPVWRSIATTVGSRRRMPLPAT